MQLSSNLGQIKLSQKRETRKRIGWRSYHSFHHIPCPFAASVASRVRAQSFVQGADSRCCCSRQRTLRVSKLHTHEWWLQLDFRRNLTYVGTRLARQALYSVDQPKVSRTAWYHLLQCAGRYQGAGCKQARAYLLHLRVKRPISSTLISFIFSS